MIFQRLDLFKIAFACYIGGALLYDRLPLLIPLRYDIDRWGVLLVMVVGLAGYLAGSLVRRHFRPDRMQVGLELEQEALRAQKQFLVGLSVATVLVVLGLLLFLRRGIPLLAENPQEAAAIKTMLNVRAYGLTRATDVWLPFVAIYCVGLSLRYSNKVHVRGVALGVWLGAFGLLFLKAGKGNVLVLLLGLLYIYDVTRPGRLRLLSWKTFATLGAGAVAASGAFYATEGADWIHSFQYVMARILVYSWEAFNFVVSKGVEPDLGHQVAVFLSLRSGDSPDIELARQMLQRQDVPFGVVPTLFGFLYRNGGLIAVAAGFAVLGFVVRSVLIAMQRPRGDLLTMTALFFVYIMLWKMLLVGNVFHSLRGFGLSVLLIFLLLRVARMTVIRLGMPPDGFGREAPSVRTG